MRKYILLIVFAVLCLTSTVQGAGTVGIGLDSATLIGMYKIDNNITIGGEVSLGLSYFGAIGRYYFEGGLAGPYAGVVLGSRINKSSAPYAATAIKLQGGYGFVLNSKARANLGLSTSGIMAEVHYLF